MAAVWEVVDENGRKLALKSPDARLEPRTVARFAREMQALSRLEHENLVRAVDSFVDGDYLFLVMERIEGSSLSAAIFDGRFEWRRALGVTRQILAGVGHAHEWGYVHRDLKPDNVMLVPAAGRIGVKVIDFGLVKPVGGEEVVGSNLTTAGTVFGSPAYMSPEQALGNEVDGRADLYAVGVMLFEMLTGVLPFDDDSPHNVMKMQVTQKAPRVEDVLPDDERVPRGVSEVVATALAKPPRQRWPDARAMIAAVDAVLAKR